MAMSSKCSEFDVELYSVLAEYLLTGEPVPDELKKMWVHAKQCLECMAKVEENRLCLERIRTRLRAEQAEPSVLVMSLTWITAAWQLRILRRSGFVGPESSITMRSESRAGRTQTTVVEFEGYAVEIKPRRSSVHVTVFSSDFSVDRLIVKAMDPKGQCLAQQTTNRNGAAALKFPASRTSYDLMIQWPQETV